jgi:hypothetical protein
MKKELPEYIYKYTSINQYLFELIIRGDLWFASPLNFNFNDPYDSGLPIDYMIEFHYESFTRCNILARHFQTIAY